MSIFDPDFLPLLLDFDVPENHESPHVVYGLWHDYRLAYFNRAWFTFAAENRGEPAISTNWPLGRSLFDAIPADLSGFYAEKFQECLRSGSHWSHDYECSSDKHYRKYHQTTYPLKQSGLIVINSLLVETPHEQSGAGSASVDIGAYLDENRLIHQCCHCRRVNNQRKLAQWDWVPLLVKHTDPRTTHGICPHCLNHYYPEAKKFL